MGYFSELTNFESQYKLQAIDRLKLKLLYPVFKLHFWFYYGSSLKKIIARLFFSTLPSNLFIPLRCHSRAFNRYFKIPIWLVPDHLSSFREIIWFNAYALDTDWAPTSLIDAGANVGYASLYFGMSYGIKKILAIEANPELVPKIKMIAEILKTEGIDMRVAKGALVGRPRTLSFEVHENSRDSSVTGVGEKGKATVTVEGLRFSAWRDRVGFSAKDFEKDSLLKIDIEGGEYEVLENDSGIFSCHYLIAEVHGEASRRDQFVGNLPKALNVEKRNTSDACKTVEVTFATSLS